MIGERSLHEWVEENRRASTYPRVILATCVKFTIELFTVAVFALILTFLIDQVFGVTGYPAIPKDLTQGATWLTLTGIGIKEAWCFTE